MNNVDIPLFVWWDGHNEEQCLFLNEHLMLIYLRNELATYWNNYNTGLQVKTSPRLWYFVFSGFLFLQNSTILLFPSLFNHSLFTVFHLLQIRHKRWKKAQNNTRSKATAICSYTECTENQAPTLKWLSFPAAFSPSESDAALNCRVPVLM